MTYVVAPLVLLLAFVGYVLYLALVKKTLKKQFNSVVLPGLFFIAAWAVVYFLIFG